MDDGIKLNGLTDRMSTLTPSCVQHVPCRVHHDGTADVEGYFKPQELGNGVQVGTFRGRKWVGSSMKLPPGSVGLVMEQGKTETDKWECQCVFDEIVYWNFDKNPAENDKQRRWKDWFDLAKAIHE